MEEIWIYRSIRKNALLLGCVFYLAISIIFPFVFIIVSDKIGLKKFCNEFIFGFFNEMGVFMGSVILLVGGLGIIGYIYYYFSWVYRLLRDQIRHIPYYIITDRSFIVNHDERIEVSFANIEEFAFKKDKAKGITFESIEIQYKDGVDIQKYKEYKTIDATKLTVTPLMLLDLLNERLAAAKPKNRY